MNKKNKIFVDNLKKSCPLKLSFVVGLGVASWLSRTLLSEQWIYQNEKLNVISDEAANSLANLVYNQWYISLIPAVCFLLFFLLYVHAQRKCGTAPEKALKNPLIGILVSVVFVALECLTVYLVFRWSGYKYILNEDELKYQAIIRSTLLGVYLRYAVIDVGLYVLAVIFGRPKRQ